MFAFHAERFAARRQNVRLWRLADDAFGQCCRNADHVIAIVEHKEDLLVANKGQQTNERVLSWRHVPDCRRNRCRHELGIGQCSQIDEEDRVMESINQRMSYRDCHSRFTDTAGADDADEAPHLELLRQRSNNLIAADHPRQSLRQLLNSFCGGGPSDRNRLLDHRAYDWRDETITATNNIRHIASAVSSVAKRLPKGSDLQAQIAFLDRHIRPCARDQLLVSDDFPGPLRERDQDVERAGAERYRLVSPLE